MDKELDELKKHNDELKLKIADLVAKRDREIYEMGDRLSTIMSEVYNFMKDYVSFVDSQNSSIPGPRLYFNTTKEENREVGIRFNSFLYNPEDDTLYYRTNYYKTDLVVPTIVEWIGRYEYVNKGLKVSITCDETINELYDGLKCALESDGKGWNRLARNLVKYHLEKEHTELEERVAKLA